MVHAHPGRAAEKRPERSFSVAVCLSLPPSPAPWGCPQTVTVDGPLITLSLEGRFSMETCFKKLKFSPQNNVLASPFLSCSALNVKSHGHEPASNDSSLPTSVHPDGARGWEQGWSPLLAAWDARQL